jgi:hypothetical protein
VKTNVKCTRCDAFIEFSSSNNIKCTDGHINDISTECPECLHQVYFIHTCSHIYRTNTCSDNPCYRQCYNNVCNKCAKRKLDESIIAKYKTTTRFGFELQIEDHFIPLRGDVYVYCCTACFEKLNKLL